MIRLIAEPVFVLGVRIAEVKNAPTYSDVMLHDKKVRLSNEIISALNPSNERTHGPVDTEP